MSEKIFGKSCRNTFCVFSGFLCEIRFTQRREGRGVCPYMRKRCTQKSQKTTEFASHVSAKVCAVCVWQFFSAGFCVFRGFCVRPPHAEPRRLCETLRLCVRRKYLFQSKTLHTEITENHRILLRMLLRMSAPSAWDNNAPHGILWVPWIPCETPPYPQGSMFLCQKSCTQNSPNTQKLCFACSADVCAVCVRQFHSARH